MFNQTVDQVADQAIAILRTGGGSAALASKATLADLDSLAFRRSVFPTYGKALSFIAVNIKNGYDLVEARSILKESAIEMVVDYQQSLVVEQTVQVVETVVDEVAELKAQLAAMQASETAKSLEIRDLKVELGEAKRDASIKTEIINSLKAKNLVELVSRTKVVDKVVTKVQELVSVKL